MLRRILKWMGAIVEVDGLLFSEGYWFLGGNLFLGADREWVEWERGNFVIVGHQNRGYDTFYSLYECQTSGVHRYVGYWGDLNKLKSKAELFMAFDADMVPPPKRGVSNR